MAEDARRGRNLSSPQDELAAFGVTEADLTSGERSAPLVRFMRFQAGRARSQYLRARAAIGDGERRQLVIAEIMGDIYYSLLGELEKSQFDIFGEKVTVRRRRKMAIALSNFAQAKFGDWMASAQT